MNVLIELTNMAKKKKTVQSRERVLKIVVGVLVIIAGVLLNYLHIGTENLLGYASAGTWLIYVGFVMLLVVFIKAIVKKEHKRDERDYFVAMKASHMTMFAMIVGSFILMVVDRITQIQIPYHRFLSYMVCAILIIYVMSYKLLQQMH